MTRDQSQETRVQKWEDETSLKENNHRGDNRFRRKQSYLISQGESADWLEGTLVRFGKSKISTASEAADFSSETSSI